VTEVLATLYNLNILSTADELCQKEVKGHKITLKVREGDLKKTQDELAKYAGFEELKIEIEGLVLQEKNCIALRNEIEWFKSCENQIQVLSESIGKLKAASGVHVPETAKTEKSITDLEWTRKYEQELIRLARSVKELQSASSVTVPDYTATSKALEDLSWLQDIETKATVLNGRVKKLETIKGISAPDPTGVADRLGEVSELQKLDGDYSRLSRITGQLDVMLRSMDVEALSASLAQASSLVDEYQELNNLDRTFLSTAGTTKTARDAFRATVAELEQVDAEYKKYKVCPLCEKPL